MKDRSSQSSTSPEKPPLGYRLGRGLRSVGEFGRDSVRDPRSIPVKAEGWFRRWARKVWSVRGGGLYALGYIVTFVWFEITTLVGEVADAEGVGDFVTGQAAEFVFRFASDSIENMIKAFVWPYYVVQISPPYGAIALGLGFLGFSAFLKKPIERWLFDGDEAANTTED